MKDQKEYKGAVILTTIYKGKDLEKIKKHHKELEEATYIGEDGDMVCIATNKEEALEKFKKRALEDEPNLDYLDAFNLENIGIGWLHLAREEDKMSYDSDWFVSYGGKERTKFEVYVLEIA